MAKRSKIKAERRSKARREQLASMPKLAQGTKFHIKTDGSVEPCRYPEGNCVLGVDRPHFDTYEEAKGLGDRMISLNPRIAEIPESPHEDFFYQILTDELGVSQGWYSRHNGYSVSGHELSEMKLNNLSHKEYMKDRVVGVNDGNSILLGAPVIGVEDTLTVGLARELDMDSIYDTVDEVEYRLTTNYLIEDGKKIPEYVSIDGYKYGVWTEEHTSFLPVGTYIDREAKPWSIK